MHERQGGRRANEATRPPHGLIQAAVGVEHRRRDLHALAELHVRLVEHVLHGHVALVLGEPAEDRDGRELRQVARLHEDGVVAPFFSW